MAARHTPIDQAHRPRAVGWLLASAVGLVALTVVVAFDAARYFSVPEQALPNLVGTPFDQAARQLRALGFEPVTFVEHVEGVEAGTVTSQSPQPGAVVKRLRTVHLGVNTPPAAAVLPDLVGVAEAAAVARAAELNVPLGTTTYAPSAHPAGTVVAQSPGGGQRLGEGGSLDLTVSSGPGREPVIVPDLVGTDLDKAVQELTKLGFGRVETIASTVSFARPGTVVATAPAPGAAVPPGTPVMVQYSLSTSSAVKVPEVIGMPQWRAQLALSAAQLVVGTVTYVTDAGLPEGVVAAVPDGYTLPGTPVFLTVNGAPPAEPFDLFGGGRGGVAGQGSSQGSTSGQDPTGTGGGTAGTPSDGSRLVPFTFDPTNMGVKRLLEQPYQLRLVVTDDQGERVALDRRVAAGQSVTTSILVYGDGAMLQTYIDDVFFQAWRP